MGEVVGYLFRKSSSGRGCAGVQAVEAVPQAVEGRQAVELWGVCLYGLQGAEVEHDAALWHASLQAVRQGVRQAVEAVGPCVCRTVAAHAVLPTVEHARRCAAVLCESQGMQGMRIERDGRMLMLADTEPHEGADVERVAYCLALMLDGCAWVTARA